MRADLDTLFEFCEEAARIETRIRVGTRHLGGYGVWFDPELSETGQWLLVYGQSECSYRGLLERGPESPCISNIYPREHDLAAQLVEPQGRGALNVQSARFDDMIDWLNHHTGAPAGFRPATVDPATGLWSVAGTAGVTERVNRALPEYQEKSAFESTVPQYFDEQYDSGSFLMVPGRSPRLHPSEVSRLKPSFPRSAERVAVVRARFNFDRLHSFERANQLTMTRVGLPDVLVPGFSGDRFVPPDPAGQEWAERDIPGPWLFHTADGEVHPFPTEGDLIRFVWSRHLHRLRTTLDADAWDEVLFALLAEFEWPIRRLDPATRHTRAAVRSLTASADQHDTNVFAHLDFVTQRVR